MNEPTPSTDTPAPTKAGTVASNLCACGIISSRDVARVAKQINEAFATPAPSLTVEEVSDEARTLWKNILCVTNGDHETALKEIQHALSTARAQDKADAETWKVRAVNAEQIRSERGAKITFLETELADLRTRLERAEKERDEKHAIAAGLQRTLSAVDSARDLSEQRVRELEAEAKQFPWEIVGKYRYLASSCPTGTDLAAWVAQLAEDKRLIDELAKMQGCNLCSDDGERWALSTSGTQRVPEPDGFKETVDIVCIVEPEEWKLSIRDALRSYVTREEGADLVTKTGQCKLNHPPLLYSEDLY